MIYHCTACHHEWQIVKPSSIGMHKRLLAQKAFNCGWCGAPGKKIGEDWTDEPD